MLLVPPGGRASENYCRAGSPWVVRPAGAWLDSGCPCLPAATEGSEGILLLERRSRSQSHHREGLGICEAHTHSSWPPCMPLKMPCPADSFSSLCLLFPPFGLAFLLSFLSLLDAFLISVASVFHPSSPPVLFCLLSLPSPLSALASLPSHLSPSCLPSSFLLASLPSFLLLCTFLLFIFSLTPSVFSLFPLSQPLILVPFLLSFHLLSPPVCPCVPALGDPLPIHHYFHGYLAGFSVRSGRLESREVIECLYACREGLDYRDFESLGKGMKV